LSIDPVGNTTTCVPSRDPRRPVGVFPLGKRSGPFAVATGFRVPPSDERVAKPQMALTVKVELVEAAEGAGVLYTSLAQSDAEEALVSKSSE
jgi:hypothetical protein